MQSPPRLLPSHKRQLCIPAWKSHIQLHGLTPSPTPSEHLEKVLPLADAGLVPFGGAFLSELPKEGEAPKLAGSAMIAVGESREEVVEMLKKDVYTREGVWDWDKVGCLSRGKGEGGRGEGEGMGEGEEGGELGDWG